MENPINETFAECRRPTVTGRKLAYKLQVLQQPERARACGAGRKCRIEKPLIYYTELIFFSIG